MCQVQGGRGFEVVITPAAARLQAPLLLPLGCAEYKGGGGGGSPTPTFTTIFSSAAKAWTEVLEIPKAVNICSGSGPVGYPLPPYVPHPPGSMPCGMG